MTLKSEFKKIRGWALDHLSVRTQTGLINAMIQTDIPICSIPDLCQHIEKGDLSFSGGKCYFHGVTVTNLGKKSWLEIERLYHRQSNAKNIEYSKDIEAAIALLTKNNFKIIYPS